LFNQEIEMNTHLAIYLAGNIQKGHENESAVFWTDEDREKLQRGLSPCVISFLNPAIQISGGRCSDPF
jgi:hypothetical protein